MSNHNKSMEKIKGQIKQQNARNKEMTRINKSETDLKENNLKELDDLWNELGLKVQRQGGK